MGKGIPSIPQVKLNGTRIKLMTDLSEKVVWKNSSSLFLLISSSQRCLILLALFVSFLKIACLHVSFTAYENFYKLSKNALSSCFIFHFLSIRSTRNQKLNNQTYIHLYTGSFIHKYIYGRSLSSDLLSIIIPF